MAPLVGEPANDPLLVVLVGPTASGKTALALHLAEALTGEILSCDSVAVYRGMDLGTAKPTSAERARIPHHLIDIVPPSVEYSAGDYARAARAVLAEVTARGGVPVVTGGTGLYLRALLDGLSPVPPRNRHLRQRLGTATGRRGPAFLHRLLRRLDASAARRIHANDEPKLTRAIEVTLLERRPMTESWQQQRPEPLTGYTVVQIGLEPNRKALYARINSRCEAMFSDGLVGETRALVSSYGEDCRALSALGYAQAQAVLRGELSEAQAIAATQQGHRNYAKRQLTWFRKDPRIHWLKGFGEDVEAEALNLTR